MLYKPAAWAALCEQLCVALFRIAQDMQMNERVSETACLTARERAKVSVGKGKGEVGGLGKTPPPPHRLH